MKSGGISRALVTGAVMLSGLGGCSERYITTANDTVLVVVDGVKGKDHLKTAQVHFTFAKPESLNEAGSEMVVAMNYEAVIDCEKKLWGQAAEHLKTQAGETISHQFPTPALEAANPGSVGASVLQAVCDPNARSSRRPLTAIQKDYVKRMGGSPAA